MTTGRARSRAMAVVLLLATACDDGRRAAERLNQTALYQAARRLARSESCLRMVPLEFSQSLPVPADQRSRGRFQVLFFPTDRFSPEFSVMTPTHLGMFTLDSRVAYCEQLNPTLVQRLGPSLSTEGRLSNADYYRTRARFYKLTEQLAADYWTRAPAATLRQSEIREYLKLFARLSEPGLTEHYRRSNPEFWRWLERQAN